MRFKQTAILVSILFGSGVAALAAGDDTPEWIKDTGAIGDDKGGVVKSHQLLELGVAESGGLALEGESSMRMGNLDEALAPLQKAVEMSPLDIDSRTLYAEALEKKLLKQGDHKDAALYNFVVKQWFFVYKKSEYADQTLGAKAHLSSLCGTVPKPLEPAKLFFARVLVPEDGKTKVALGKHHLQSKSDSPQ